MILLHTLIENILKLDDWKFIWIETDICFLSDNNLKRNNNKKPKWAMLSHNTRSKFFFFFFLSSIFISQSLIQHRRRWSDDNHSTIVECRIIGQGPFHNPVIWITSIGSTEKVTNQSLDTLEQIILCLSLWSCVRHQNWLWWRRCCSRCWRGDGYRWWWC